MLQQQQQQHFIDVKVIRAFLLLLLTSFTSISGVFFPRQELQPESVKKEQLEVKLFKSD